MITSFNMDEDECRCSGQIMDVLFVIDATGSMSSAIRAAHDRAASIAADLRRDHPDVDFWFGSVCYRDPIDSHCDFHQVCDFTPHIDRLVSFFTTVQANGGGDGPEDWVGALNLSLTAVHWREGRKTLIWIADAPAHGRRFCGMTNHDDETAKLPPLIVQLARSQIHVQGLNLGGGATTTFVEFKKIYDEAGGPSCTYEQFSVGYRAAPPPTRVDALGRDIDAADFPKDYPSDEDYDSDEDSHGMAPRKNRPPVIDETSYAVSIVEREGGSDDVGSGISRTTAAAVSRALRT
jgi:hypothetical protein